MAVFDDVAATTVDPLAELVGADKKYKTVEDLAKGRIEADAFIETLKKEAQTARDEAAAAKAELTARTTIEDQIKALTTKQVPQNSNPQTERVEDKGPDLSQRIKAELEAQERSRVLTGNIKVVADKLVEIYGSEEKARELVNLKAQELGVSPKWLMDSAAASPKAFFNTIGLDAKVVTAPVTHGDVRTDAFRNTNSNIAPGSYDELKAKVAGNDVRKLMDPAYLNAGMDAALKDPDKFFNGNRWV